MKSKLGIYVINVGAFDAVNYFSIAKPRIAVSMDHNLDQWRAIKQASPNTFVIGRLGIDEGEQHFDHPESDAQNFFNRMKPESDKMRGVYDAWMAYNETAIDSEDDAKRISRFYVKWGDLMRAANLVSAAYSFSTGSPKKGDPDNNHPGQNEPKYWPLLVDGARHCDLLSLHEYSAPTMDNISPFLCLRYRAVRNLLPADARRPIVITETGVDGGPIGRPQEGWKKFFTSEADYLATLQWYDKEIQKDDYIIGATIFAAANWPDFGPHFGSFSIVGLNQIRDYIAQGGDPGPISPQPPADAAKIAQEAAVVNKPWMPINDGGALYKFALKNELGYPQTDEFEYFFGGDIYVAQVYNLGIVYVKKGDWGNCKWVKKP